MSEEKKVSIILCFYNEEKYLAKAIDSVLAQTYSNFELILVNDGSTDGSDAIVKSYQDERIVYKAYEGNKRLAYARNRGLELATGEYIGFFDGDDLLLEDKIEKQVNYLNEHTEIALVSGAFQYMDADGVCFGEVNEPKCKSDLEIRAYMLFGNTIACAGGALFRRKIIEQHKLRLDETNKASEDYRFWIEMLPYGKFANVKDCFFLYRVNHGSKASLIVKRDENAYDIEVMKVLNRAWEMRGFSLQENDISWIYHFVFKHERAYNPKDIYKGLQVYKKVRQQLPALHLEEESLILQFYKQQWACSYHTYWFFKKIFGKKDS